MSSGVPLADNCVEKFNDLKLRKAFRYLSFMIDKVDGTDTIVLESEGSRDATYAEFLGTLPNDPRYYIFCENPIDWIVWGGVEYGFPQSARSCFGLDCAIRLGL
eukprot:NODE_4025_length_705_cov_130.759146_g3403_i0.p2 GENE.NODE_4025_length_705_cov_130.759146_g3403_i0~~NODE_4025_length_705_cov_130.759146_g3403_i0.p2  ORF type:complete len:104 (+),score=9.46 NODE_4025_length_705_cov_130.759146_g3403_i0:77-388(+)